MAITVVGDPTRSNPMYYSKLHKLELDYRRIPGRPATRAELVRTHSPDYVDHVLDGYSDEWIGFRPDLVNRARESFGSAITAVTHVYRDTARKVFVPGGGRPHATQYASDRLCIFNDIAAAATWLRRRELYPMVIDLDGLYAPALDELLSCVDGITLFSVHDETPFASESRPPDSVYNVMLPEGAGDMGLIDAVDRALGVIDEVCPDVLLVNVGATGHFSDELSSLEYTHEGIYEAVVRISQRADEYCASRMIGFGGVSSAGNEWAAAISAAATHAMSLPYTPSSAKRTVPFIPAE